MGRRIRPTAPRPRRRRPRPGAGAQRYRRRFEAHFALLDGLGWTYEDDRDTFTVTADRTVLEEHLADQANQVRSDLPMHREELECLKARDRQMLPPGSPEKDFELAVADVREGIAGDERLLGVYETLLALLDSPNTTVVDAAEVTRDEALGLLVAEHEVVLEALMATVDLVGVVQKGLEQVDLGNLRKAAADTMRRSIEGRGAAVEFLKATP